MGIVESAAAELRGLSFRIADLILIGAWSEARGLHMAVRLDHGTETEEYEEVLAFHSQKSRPCRWIMWRDADAFFVQPLPGRTRRYGSLAEVFEAVAPEPPVAVTDIIARNWPDQREPVQHGRNSDRPD
jgi:hypothetical protein